MTPERWKKIRSLFDAVVEQPKAAQAAYLEEHCREDPSLRAEVEALLADDANLPSLLQQPAGDLAAALLDADTTAPKVPQRVGPYRIVRELGRGGMGTVYLAERDDQFKRQVALKLVKRGMDTDEVLRRFRHERQILARLEHPHIARLYDGGVNDQDEAEQPYLVMEYVEGLPIDRYCDLHQLNVTQRLQLFETVCDAVQYAHQSLVVHRDLKPSNILVRPDGTVKLLDFGIAKLLSEDAPLDSIPETRAGSRLMTPAYASPEQLRGRPVTTTSDVYSLGVLLYELLTGRRPFNLQGKSQAEAEHILLEKTPARPSTAVTTVDVGEARATTVERLQRQLRGDLDTILLKALRKEPQRRYASAEALSNDLRLYRAGRPVLAQPDTLGYRLKKTLYRNRWPAAIALLLIGLSTGFGVFYTVRVAQERDLARLEAQKAQAVADFMGTLLAAPDPRLATPTTRPDTLRIRDFLDQSAQKVRQDLTGQPEIQAQMLTVLGNVYRSLAQYPEAHALLTETLELRKQHYGPDHPETAEGLTDLGALLADKGDLDEAERIARSAVALHRSLQGPQHLDTAASLGLLADVLMKDGRYDEAEPLFKQSLAIQQRHLDPDDPQVMSTLGNLAALYNFQSDYQAAAAQFRELLALRKQHYGPTHPLVATTMNNLALVLRESEAYAEAEPYAREALALNRQAYGQIHPTVAANLMNLGAIFRSQGRLEEAEAAYQASLDMNRTLLGEDHGQVGMVMTHLAELRRDRGNYTGAAELYRTVLDRAKQQDSRVGVAIISSLLARVLHEGGQRREAEALYRDALTRLTEVLGPDHARTARARIGLGLTLMDQKQYAAAEPYILEGYRQLQDKNLPVETVKAHLVALYEAWGKPQEADRYR